MASIGKEISGVVPLVGTWIEIWTGNGIKSGIVVPLVGTWIEMKCGHCYKEVYEGRAPRGHVD